MVLTRVISTEYTRCWPHWNPSSASKFLLPAWPRGLTQQDFREDYFTTNCACVGLMSATKSSSALKEQQLLPAGDNNSKDQQEEFIAAAAFTGPREGYAFTTGAACRACCCVKHVLTGSYLQANISLCKNTSLNIAACMCNTIQQQETRALVITRMCRWPSG